MASHVFHEIYLHINWHTKDDLPLLGPELEKQAHAHIIQRCRNTKGVYFHGVGGTATHIHLAINIEPFVSVSTLVGEMKGSCSHDINKALGRKIPDWQRGYGVVSFGKNNLEWVLKYIANQREHHAKGKVFDRLERIGVYEEAEGKGREAEGDA
jgi:putative transposase